MYDICLQCRPEYKIPGLYIVDSIVRQSRHQFGSDKDVFGPRFMRNLAVLFHSLLRSCPPDDIVSTVVLCRMFCKCLCVLTVLFYVPHFIDMHKVHPWRKSVIAVNANWLVKVADGVVFLFCQ